MSTAFTDAESSTPKNCETLNPDATANYASQLTFWWFNDLMSANLPFLTPICLHSHPFRLFFFFFF